MSGLRLLVLGGTGRTGKHVITQALERGYVVTALVRDPRRLAHPTDNVRVLAGSVLDDGTALAAAVRDQDVVISALGAGDSLKSLGLFATFIPRLLRDMERSGIRRLILTSAFGVGDSYRDTPFIPRLFIHTLLRDLYRDKNAGETILRQSALDWTIVYPTGLTNGPATGHYRLGERLTLSGFPTIARANVADFLVKQVEDTSYVRKGVLISA